MTDPQIGQVYRERSDWARLRTLKVTEVLDDAVCADVLTDTRGNPPKSHAQTRLKLTTLRRAYQLV